MHNTLGVRHVMTASWRQQPPAVSRLDGRAPGLYGHRRRGSRSTVRGSFSSARERPGLERFFCFRLINVLPNPLSGHGGGGDGGGLEGSGAARTTMKRMTVRWSLLHSVWITFHPAPLSTAGHRPVYRVEKINVPFALLYIAFDSAPLSACAWEKGLIKIK